MKSIRYAKGQDDKIPPVPVRNAEREGIERVYQKYGPNLAAFYEDMKKQVALEKCDSDTDS